MDQDTPLIITGMGRSGTSLLARFAHESGVNMGRELVGPADSNVHGHFEDAEIVAFHVGILKRECGSHWLADRPPRTTGEDRERAGALVEARRESDCWGWKDPRTSLFLEFWQRIVPHAYYLFTLRHPPAIVDSMRRAEKEKSLHWRTNNRILKGWLAHTRECELFRRKNTSRCMSVRLESVIEDPKQFTALLANTTGREWDAEVFAASFCSASMNRRAAPVVVAPPWTLLRCAVQFSALCRSADM